MKSFRDLIKESPVGMVGRTGTMDAQMHIDNSDIKNEFKKIVKKLGGKTVAKALLDNMSKKEIMSEAKESIESYLRDSGYKIKFENPTRNGKEIEFYKKSDAESAFEDLKSAGFGKDFDLSLVNTIITYS